MTMPGVFSIFVPRALWDRPEAAGFAVRASAVTRLRFSARGFRVETTDAAVAESVRAAFPGCEER